eukprot:1147255-Pelagomonas_calceolata.AAC.6
MNAPHQGTCALRGPCVCTKGALQRDPRIQMNAPHQSTCALRSPCVCTKGALQRDLRVQMNAHDSAHAWTGPHDSAIIGVSQGCGPPPSYLPTRTIEVASNDSAPVANKTKSKITMGGGYKD